jgi:hypothetical protein
MEGDKGVIINYNLCFAYHYFNLLAGGLSFILIALFYQFIDVWGWRKWTLFFRVIGMNSIFHLPRFPVCQCKAYFRKFIWMDDQRIYGRLCTIGCGFRRHPAGFWIALLHVQEKDFYQI